MTFISNIPLNKSWQNILMPELEKEYMQTLDTYLTERKNAGAVIYPEVNDVFSAFNTTHYNNVKVVILGQDPYHGEGQAHGLCFSVKSGVRTPPSLKNIYKEMQTDLGIEPVEHGYLQNWAEQGVLMLNSVLTVEKSQAAAHQKQGWEQFTDAVIKHLNDNEEGIVFMLWGAYAHKKGAHIDESKHLVLRAAHPSPFAAHKGFFGCKHFSQCNAYLEKLNKKAINWQL